jgi:hypothetical protein
MTANGPSAYHALREFIPNTYHALREHVSRSFRVFSQLLGPERPTRQRCLNTDDPPETNPSLPYCDPPSRAHLYPDTPPHQLRPGPRP